MALDIGQWIQQRLEWRKKKIVLETTKIFNTGNLKSMKNSITKTTTTKQKKKEKKIKTRLDTQYKRKNKLLLSKEELSHQDKLFILYVNV